MTTLAICGNRPQQQFQYLSTVLDIKTGQLFCGIQLMQRNALAL